MRVFAGLVSDPFFMDVEAALRTGYFGQTRPFNRAANTVQFRDVLSIVVEIPIAPIVQDFDGMTLVGAIAENIVTRRGKPIRIERLGRPEIKNFVLANTARDPRTKGVELRDLYNREDAFAPLQGISATLRVPSRRESGVSSTVWTARLRGRLGQTGAIRLRDLLIDDFLILDLAHAFAPGSFLEIERSLINNEPHESAGGRWLDDDILDEMLTLL